MIWNLFYENYIYVPLIDQILLTIVKTYVGIYRFRHPFQTESQFRNQSYSLPLAGGNQYIFTSSLWESWKSLVYGSPTLFLKTILFHLVPSSCKEAKIPRQIHRGAHIFKHTQSVRPIWQFTKKKIIPHLQRTI